MLCKICDIKVKSMTDYLYGIKNAEVVILYQTKCCQNHLESLINFCTIENILLFMSMENELSPDNSTSSVT